MELFAKITAFISSHTALTATIVTVLWEILGRLTPTEKRASLFSWAGKLLKLIGELSFTISDALGKVIPDNRKK